MPSLKIGDELPNIVADSTHGVISLHEYYGDSWGILFSHPADFTPVCTTELGEVQRLHEEFSRRNVKCVALSCDSAESHRNWLPDIAAVTGQEIQYPILADENREVATALGMIDQTNSDSKGLPLTVRGVFIIGADKKIKAFIFYPASTGRNFNEIIRVIDSLQLTANRGLATPANWTSGQACVVAPSIPTDVARERFSDLRVLDLPSGKQYLRFTNEAK